MSALVVEASGDDYLWTLLDQQHITNESVTTETEGSGWVAFSQVGEASEDSQKCVLKRGRNSQPRDGGAASGWGRAPHLALRTWPSPSCAAFPCVLVDSGFARGWLYFLSPRNPELFSSGKDLLKDYFLLTP